MSAFAQIPYDDACPECGRPGLELEGELHCANKACLKYREVVR